MSNRLPLSVQHVVPSVTGPIATGLLLAATVLGQFHPGTLLFPFTVILLLPPIGRAVWSFIARRPVVTGRLDQRLLGLDVLLVFVAVLEAGKGSGTPVILLLIGAGCGLGLLAGARRIVPAVAVTAGVLLVARLLGGIDEGWISVLFTAGGLAAFSLLPPRALERARGEAAEAMEALRRIERTARDLREDSAIRQSEVRRESYSPEVVQEEINAMGARVHEWLEATCETLVAGTGADRCMIYVANAEQGTLDLDARSRDAGQVAPTVRVREGVFGAVFKTSETLLKTTVRQPATGLVYAGDPDAVGSLLVVPVMTQRGPWGAIVLDAAVPESLTMRDRALVEGIAPLLLSLLAQLVELSAYRQGSGEDKMLHDTSQQLARQESLDEVARILVERTVNVVQADAGALSLVQEDASLRVQHATGFDRDPTGRHYPFDKTTSLVAQSIHYVQPLTQTRQGGDRRPPLLFGAEFGPAGGFTDILVMPLLEPGSENGERSCIGAICLTRRGNRPFDDNDRGRVEMLTHQAAAHILNIRLLEESKTQAKTDGLTGLPNRRSFVERLDEMLQRASRFGTPVSLMILDVDHFKHVNDTYGHPVGDQVLRRLAELLRRSVREAVDMAARYGGEEFVLLLENTAHDGALKLAERLRAALEAETFIHMEGSNAIQFKVTMSIGVCSYPEAGDAMVLVERADQALYRAKESGRNRVVSALS